MRCELFFRGYGLISGWILVFKLSVTTGFVTETDQVQISELNQTNAVAAEKKKCLEYQPAVSRLTGLYCNQTFDTIACWPITPAGTTQYLPCPNYIQGFYTRGNATRQCMPEGRWFFNPDTNNTWTDYRQCFKPIPTQQTISPLYTVHITHIRVMSTTGYGISFCSLLLAVFIMLYFKRLHCPRNTVHLNMFFSFILRAILTFLKDILWVQGLGFPFDLETTANNEIVFREDRVHWECKLLITLFHYVLSANYMWILVEGLYLHTLVYVSVFSERGNVKWYYVLGWGTPLLSILPWVVVRLVLENILCWNTNPTQGYFWILKGPIWLSIVINFIFFINILRALFYKLHKLSTSSARRNRYRRLAKATLILIPLFGVHYIVFMGVNENVNPAAEVVKLYIEMFFNSFQGFLVAVLFCFLNKEVQMELRKTWYRLCQRPDPVYIQQRQYLVDANWQRRQINSRNSLNTRSRVSENQPPSSDGSTDTAGCLCKWTLNKNGKLTRTVVNASSLKRNKSKHVQKNNNESRL